MKKSLFSSTLLSLILLLLFSTFIVSRNVPDLPMFISSSAWSVFLASLAFMMFRSGKISKYRSIFFIIYAFSFVLVFISHLVEQRGGMAITQEVIDNRLVPLCPVAIPMLILPAVFKQALIFPTKLIGGEYGGFYPIFFLWLVSLVTLGRGWCSWACFYGGIDEGFSKMLKRPVISCRKMNPNLRYLPFALLIVIVIWAFVAMEPVYCTWLCPLKLVTEYVEINNLVAYLQAIIFITLGMGLLVVLPLLMKKRTQCALFCPLGALQSVTGSINPYRVKIDKDKCIKCGRCKTVCPTFSITDDTIRTKKISNTCTRCGKCMEVCKQNAINYTLLGVPFTTDDKIISGRITGNNPSRIRKLLVWPVRVLEEILDARTLFIFSGLLFGAILSASFVPQAMVRVYNLLINGTLLLH